MTAPYAQIVGPAARDAVIRTVYGEARGEPDEGKAAVAWVIRNRAEHPAWWGATLYRICYQRAQFDCWLPNDPNSKICRLLSESDPGYIAIGKIVDGVLAGTIEDPTKGATHYYRAGTPAPKWSMGRTPDATIGHHAFYNVGPGT